MDINLEKKIISMFSNGNKSKAYSLGKVILLNRKKIIADLVKEGLSLRVIFLILKEEYDLPSFISLRYFYFFIKNYKDQIFVSDDQNKNIKASSSVKFNNYMEESKEKINLSVLSTKKNISKTKEYNGQEVAVKVTSELYNFIYIPNKLYFLSRNDNRFPKYFPDKYKSDRYLDHLIPWQNSAGDLLISDENELYIPDIQLPLLDNLCFNSTGGGMFTDYESRPVANLNNYAAYLLNLFNHSFSKNILHGRKI